jgi:uncharacterized membrane protein
MGTMRDRGNVTERYLAELRSNLAALGPVEADELIAEVRGNLADALADSGSDEVAAVSTLGSAGSLAARFLDERGLITGPNALPEAPAWARAAAVALDIVPWIPGGLIFGFELWVLLAALPTSLLPLGDVAGTYATNAVLIAILAGLVAWWVRRRRRPGYVSAGQQLMHIRRVPLGTTTRMVRTGEIAGTVRHVSLVRWVVMLLVAYVAITLSVGMIDSLGRNSESNRIGEVRRAVQDAGTAQQLVVGMYLTAEETAPVLPSDDSTQTRLTREILARRKAGRVRSFQVSALDLPDDWRPDPHRSGHPYSSATLVTVDESWASPEGSFLVSNYTYTVLQKWTPQGAGISEGEWSIASVAQSGDYQTP